MLEMNFFTHIAISKIIYDHLKLKIDLDKNAFIFGNVKPDLTYKLKKNPHILENHLFDVCDGAKELMKGKESLKELSTDLGQICHYICDFFCRYHLNILIFNKLARHFLYELKLQFVLFEMTGSEKSEILEKNKSARKDIESIIFEMRNDYLSGSAEMKNDITYAISTAIWVCESVLYFQAQSVEPALDNELEFYNMLPLAGGR